MLSSPCHHLGSTPARFLGLSVPLRSQVIDKMVREGPPPTIRVINALLEACVRNDDVEAAKKLFSSLRGVRGEGSGQMLTPDTEAGVSISLQPTEVSYNIMVNAYAKARQVNQVAPRTWVVCLALSLRAQRTRRRCRAGRCC